MWNRRACLAGLTSAAATPALAAAAPADAYPLWRLHAGDTDLFLFGDCGSARDPWQSARALAALQRSAALWVETPQIGPAEAQLFVQRGTDRDRSLSQRLTPRQRDRVAAAAAAVGMSYGDLEHYRPWLAASSLNARSAGRSAPSRNPAIALGRAAVAAGKPIRTEFPDIPSMLAFFESFSPQAEVEYLMNTVDILAQGDEAWMLRQKTWERGDIGLETRRVLAQMRTYPAGYEAGTGVRNRRWVRRLKDLLASGEPSFVLVGATHLVGPAGILNLLKREGLSVRRV